MKQAFLMFLIAAYLAVTVGCIGVQGGSEQIKSEQTMGQELLDLKKAKDEGAINQEEYEELRKKVMDRGD